MFLIFAHSGGPDLDARRHDRVAPARLGGLGGHGLPVRGRRHRRRTGRRRAATRCSRGVDQQSSAVQPGGNMEGKEVRFGIANSALFATVTTDASCGAVNAMHDSFTPLGGLVPLANILLGEVIFGGVGAGLYGILIFVILTVFIAGLMVGRTPEYLGKKIEAFDVKMAMLAVLIFPLTILTLTGIADRLAVVRDVEPAESRARTACREILYAYTSGTGNNGSAFAGLSANTPWYNTTLGIAMLLGRFMAIIPMLALAGNLARKKTRRRRRSARSR